MKEGSEKVGLKLNIQKTKIMASSSITSWKIDGKIMKTVRDFILGSSKITADGDYSHEVKRHLLLGRKATTHRGWSHHQILCLPTGQHGQLNNREPGPSNA